MAHLNFSDIMVIALSSLIVVWGGNYILRTVNLNSFQA